MTPAEAVPGGAHHWLFSTDPEVYSIEHFFRAGEDRWDGVRGGLAQRYLRQVKAEDEILIYHTGPDRAIVGLARCTRPPYPDPEDSAGKRVAVDVRPERRLRRPIPLAEIKARPELKGMPFVRIPRLSISPVTPDEWAMIRRLEESGG